MLGTLGMGAVNFTHVTFARTVSACWTAHGDSQGTGASSVLVSGIYILRACDLNVRETHISSLPQFRFG